MKWVDAPPTITPEEIRENISKMDRDDMKKFADTISLIGLRMAGELLKKLLSIEVYIVKGHYSGRFAPEFNEKVVVIASSESEALGFALTQYPESKGDWWEVQQIDLDREPGIVYEYI